MDSPRRSNEDTNYDEDSRRTFSHRNDEMKRRDEKVHLKRKFRKRVEKSRVNLSKQSTKGDNNNNNNDEEENADDDKDNYVKHVKVEDNEREEDEEDKDYEAEKESSPSISLEVASDSCSSVEFHWNTKENIKLETDCPGDLIIRQEVTEETDSSYANPSRISFVSSISYTISSYDPQLEEERSFIQRLSTREKELEKSKDNEVDDDDDDDDDDDEEYDNDDVKSPGLSCLPSTGFLNDAKNKPITGIGVSNKRRARVRESRKESSAHSFSNANRSSSTSSSDDDKNAGSGTGSVVCPSLAPKSFMIRHHSDETLDRNTSRIDRRTNRYYRRRSQEFIFKPLSPFIVPDPNRVNTSSSACDAEDKRKATISDDSSSDSEVKVTAKPPLTTIQLQWVKSNIYSPRPNVRRNSEELVSYHVNHSPNTPDIQSTVSLDNLTQQARKSDDLRPVSQINAPTSSNNLSSSKSNLNRSINASVDSVDFRCLDDFLPKISSSDPIIYKKNAGENQVDEASRVSRYDSMLTVSTGHHTGGSQSLISHLSPTNDSGVSSQSVASSPILSQAPSPPPRNRIGKLSSIYGSIIKQRSPSAASTSSSTPTPLAKQSQCHLSVSSSCSDLYRKQLGSSSYNNNHNNNNNRNNNLLSHSYHGELIQYNDKNNNNAIDETCSKDNGVPSIKPKNNHDHDHDSDVDHDDHESTIMKPSLEPKKSVRDIIKNIESNLKATSPSQIISPIEKLIVTKSELESNVIAPPSATLTINSDNRSNDSFHEHTHPHHHRNHQQQQQRRPNILKREQFRKLKEPLITQVQLPNRCSSVIPTEEPLLNRPKPKPSAIINLNSWSRSKPNKFLAGAKFRKITSKDSKIRKLDEAISELEEIYASLNLDDEDLLDRAERRDMPTKFQLMRFNSPTKDSFVNVEVKRDVLATRQHIGSPRQPSPPLKRSLIPVETGWSHPHCEDFCSSRHRRRSLGCVEYLLSSADPPYRDKAPPRRRSAIPDPVTDDLAARKMVKNQSELMNISADDKKIPSYLLLSPIYNPTSRPDSQLINDPCSILGDNYLSTEPEPDIEKDDLSYRKFIQSEAASVLPPHPPFGIPIGITDLSTINNYVQATLSEKDRNFFYYRVKPYYPHLIKDDMAFRSFRKDLDKLQDDKILPITTNNLLSQRNVSTRNRPTSLHLPNNEQQHRHQCPSRVSLIASGFENQASLV